MKFSIILLSCIFAFINAQCPFSTSPTTGASATFYTSINNGACGYQTLTGPLGPGNDMIAALGTQLYKNGAQCGQCFKITNANGTSVTIRATDSCNDAGYCQRSSHFDLSQSAFSVLGNTVQGVLDNLKYVKVPCSTSGNVKIMMKDGSNPYWTSFLVFNTKIPVKSVQIKQPGASSFTALTQTTYNYWPTSISGTGSFVVNIISLSGQTISVTIPAVQSLKIIDTGAQFNSC